MELTGSVTFLLSLLFTSYTTVGQGKADRPYDPYFVASTDTVSAYGPRHITRDLLRDKGGNYWFATWLGIIKYDGSVFTNYTLKEDLIRFHVFCCYEDRKGNLWFGTARGGVYRYDGRSFHLFTTRDGLVDNNVSCILEDREGNIWFGTEHGVSRYDGKVFSGFGAKDGPGTGFVNCILEDRAAKLWFGTSEGLYVFDGVAFRELKNKEGRSFRVLSLLEDKKRNMWIGRWDGLTRYDGRSFTNFLSDHLTYYLTEDRKGNIWLTHSEPNLHYSNLPSQVLYRYDGKTFTRVIEKSEPNDFQIFGKIADPDGSIWFGTMQGPCRYDGKSFTYFTKRSSLK